MESYITETEKGTVIVKTKEGDFELQKLKIKDVLSIQYSSEKSDNLYDVNIEKIALRMVKPMTTEDIWKLKGSVMTRLINGSYVLNKFNGKVERIDEDTVHVLDKGKVYKFVEKPVGELRMSGSGTTSQGKIFLKQIRMSLIDPILTDEQFNELTEDLYEGFKQAANMLYYSDELSGEADTMNI